MRKPALFFVGPDQGRHPGRTPAAGRILAELFEAAGFGIESAPVCHSRVARSAEILLAMLANRRSTDLLVLQVYSGRSFLLADMVSLLGRSLGYRIVMHVHGGAIPVLTKQYPRWATRVIRRGNAIVVPSAYLQRALDALGFRATIIPNPLNLHNYRFRERKGLSPRLLWMRAFHQIYNPEMAVRALFRIRMSAPGASLVMAGPDKGCLARVQAEVERLHLREAVEFPGCIGGGAKSAALDRADIFVNTAHVDNTPVSVLEAWASGTPVVSTRVGGIPDMIEDCVSGLLVDDGDDQDMSSAVLRLLGDPQLAHRLSTNGRKTAEGCDWSCVLPEWRALLSGLSSRGHETSQRQSG